MEKIIVILGPTASGKTALSIKLAKKFNGEIISADSRQVYKGMNIGTGKITKKEMEGIPHYLLDVASPKRKFTVAQYKKLALEAINKIQKKSLPSHQNSEGISGGDGKVPFLVGGTGFYIQAVVDGIIIPEVKPDWRLRKKLEKKSTKELFKMLKKLDPKRAKTIEKNNPRRLIRALEIVLKTKKPVPLLKKQPPKFNVLILGIKKPQEELKKSIRKRLIRRLKPRTRTSSVQGKQDMIAEVKRLRKSGLSWKRLESFGLEYKYIAYYLQKKITKEQMIEKLQKEIEHFAKRQMTWFKRDKRIKWIKNQKQAEKLIKNFLKE